MNRELTREEAIKLHRQMWTDMQAELGDTPSYQERVVFKRKWVKEHFPNERVNSNCFLCEYAQSVVGDSFTRCRACPIMWNSDILPNCRSEVDYRCSPISVILALPERGGEGMINETLEAARAYRKDKAEAYERGYAQGKADAKPHWIPVTEEPKESGKYLVTAVISFVPDHIDDPDTYEAVTIANYLADIRGPIKWWGNNIEKVLAWMPLPESFKRQVTE